jgi:hypothetical protein
MPTGSYTDVFMRFRIIKRCLQGDELFVQGSRVSAIAAIKKRLAHKASRFYWWRIKTLKAYPFKILALKIWAIHPR